MAIRSSQTFRGRSGKTYKYREWELDDPRLPHTGANFILVVSEPDGSETLVAGQTDNLYEDLPDHEEYDDAEYVLVRTTNTTEEQREDELDDLESGGLG